VFCLDATANVIVHAVITTSLLHQIEKENLLQNINQVELSDDLEFILDSTNTQKSREDRLKKFDWWNYYSLSTTIKCCSR